MEHKERMLLSMSPKHDSLEIKNYIRERKNTLLFCIKMEEEKGIGVTRFSKCVFPYSDVFLMVR